MNYSQGKLLFSFFDARNGTIANLFKRYCLNAQVFSQYNQCSPYNHLSTQAFILPNQILLLISKVNCHIFALHFIDFLV